MTPHLYTVHGIVLRRRNAGEADRIITLFTREFGKIRVIAKGVRKISSRRAAHLEVFRLVHAHIHRGKSIDSITEVTSSILCTSLSIQKVNLCYYISELVDRLLPEHQEHPDIFDLTIQAFSSIDTASTDEGQNEVYAFALELLWVLGFLPRSTRIADDQIQTYIERIIERKLRTPAILTKLASKE